MLDGLRGGSGIRTKKCRMHNEELKMRDTSDTEREVLVLRSDASWQLLAGSETNRRLEIDNNSNKMKQDPFSFILIIFIKHYRQTTRVVFYRSCYRRRPCQRYSGEKPSLSVQPSH